MIGRHFECFPKPSCGDEGNGVFTATTEGEADAGWIAYIVAEK